MLSDLKVKGLRTANRIDVFLETSGLDASPVAG